MLSYLQSRFTPDQLSRMMMQGGGMGSSQLFPQQQFDPRLLAMPSIKGQDMWNGGGMR